MRHTLYLIILCLGLVEAQAQKLSKSYKETSLSDVLIDLNLSQADRRISFIYNEPGGFYRHHQFPQPDDWQCCAPGGRFLSDADY